MSDPAAPAPPPPAAPALDGVLPAQGKWLALTAAFLGWMFDGLEMGMWPLIGRPALREMLVAGGGDVDKEFGAWFGGIVAAFLLGAAAGGIVFGRLGDRIGRVKAMIIAILTYSIFAGLCAFATSPLMLGVLRFLASLGMGGEWALGVSLIMEIWPAKNRPVLAGLIGGASNVGFVVVGFMGLGLATFIGSVHAFLAGFLPITWVDYLVNTKYDGWRFLCLMGATPALLTLFIQVFVPESEKWKHAAKTATQKTRIADIFAPGIVRNTLLGACLAGFPLLATWGSVQWIPAWSGQLAEKQVKAAQTEAAPKAPEAKPGDAAAAPAPAPRRDLPDPKKAGPWAQIIIGFGAVVGTLVVAVLAEKLNRRIAYFGLCIASLAICQYLYRTPMEYDTYFLVIACLANAMTAGFYGWLPLYLPELFPTRIRATGSGFCFNIGRVIAAAGTIAGGGLLKLFRGDYAQMGAILTFVYVIMMVLIWFCPETKGKPLPE